MVVINPSSEAMSKIPTDSMPCQHPLPIIMEADKRVRVFPNTKVVFQAPSVSFQATRHKPRASWSRRVRSSTALAKRGSCPMGWSVIHWSMWEPLERLHMHPCWDRVKTKPI